MTIPPQSILTQFDIDQVYLYKKREKKICFEDNLLICSLR